MTMWCNTPRRNARSHRSHPNKQRTTEGSVRKFGSCFSAGCFNAAAGSERLVSASWLSSASPQMSAIRNAALPPPGRAASIFASACNARTATECGARDLSRGGGPIPIAAYTAVAVSRPLLGPEISVIDDDCQRCVPNGGMCANIGAPLEPALELESTAEVTAEPDPEPPALELEPPAEVAAEPEPAEVTAEPDLEPPALLLEPPAEVAAEPDPGPLPPRERRFRRRAAKRGESRSGCGGRGDGCAVFCIFGGGSTTSQSLSEPAERSVLQAGTRGASSGGC